MDSESLRQELAAELREKMRVLRGEVSPVPELILGAAEVMEIPIPFEEPEAPRDG